MLTLVTDIYTNQHISMHTASYESIDHTSSFCFTFRVWHFHFWVFCNYFAVSQLLYASSLLVWAHQMSLTPSVTAESLSQMPAVPFHPHFPPYLYISLLTVNYSWHSPFPRSPLSAVLLLPGLSLFLYSLSLLFFLLFFTHSTSINIKCCSQNALTFCQLYVYHFSG